MASPTSAASLGESSLQQGRNVANEVLLRRLTSKIQKDPSLDLADLLKQQLSAYQPLVQSLARSYCRIESDPSESSDDHDGAQPTSEWEDRIADGPMELLQPLSSQVYGCLGLDETSFSQMSRSEHLPSQLRSALIRACESAEVLHELNGTLVLGLGSDIALKTGMALDPDHICNLQYVRSVHPQIPTPECLGAFTINERAYFFMSRSPGVTLESVWADLPNRQKASVQSQLSEIFFQLRMRPAGTSEREHHLGSFNGEVCKDMRRNLRLSRTRVETEKDFNDFLCFVPGRTVTPWISNIRSFMSEDHEFVMTHGDLHPRNIMVIWDKDVQGGEIRVSAILDWEMAGWYPEHWEFVKALSTISPRGPLQDWINYLPTQGIGSYPREYSVDALLDRWLG